MKELRADLHIHTCLSPCADRQMVPTAIVRQARNAGLDVIGICDHNSGENAAAVMEAGSRQSVAVIPGMEITTREEVHLLGLMENCRQLSRLQKIVYAHLEGTNEEEVFGPQTIVDNQDRAIGTNPRLLIGATSLGLEECIEAIHECGGLAVAAHIDRPSFGLIGQLGFVSPGLGLDAVELSPLATVYSTGGFPAISSSDAHRLGDIGRVATRLKVASAALPEIAAALRERRVSIEMEDLSLHILDIVENSLEAAATEVKIQIVEETARDLLTLRISDNGRGLDEEAKKRALDPFYTTRTTRRVGLGLSLLAQAARQCGGELELSSAPGQGTSVEATFQLSHPDRQPLGDVAETLQTILVGHPELKLSFEYIKDGKLVARLDSR